MEPKTSKKSRLCYDLTRLALSWKKAKTDPAYNPTCDFTGDGELNIYDLTKLAKTGRKAQYQARNTRKL